MGKMMMHGIKGSFSFEGDELEYTIAGKGQPILVLHGGHSNCYETFGYVPLIQNGFMLITPSRPGYGETSAAIGDSLAKACRAYVQLIKHLRLKKVHILAISAGGPSGLYFASHYPEHVNTLTLQSAVTKVWHMPQDNIYRIARVIFHPYTEKYTWKLMAGMSNLFPAWTFRLMVSSFSSLTFKQIKPLLGETDIDDVRKMNHRQRSGAGFLIDLSQTKDIKSKDVMNISVPTLIMHSKYDGAVPFEHADEAHQLIRESRLCVLDSWGHLIWLGKEASAVQEQLLGFLNNR